jgi:SpoVK/Ycf46/Vps4 family AAA+-type ATPase
MGKKRHVSSPASINNYNILLKHLDDKQKEQDDKIPPLLPNKPRELTEKEKKEKMEELLKRLCETFTKFDAPCFTGKRENDNYAHCDPNRFEDCCNPIIIKKKKVSLTEEELKKILKPAYTGPKEKIEVIAEINNISDLLKLIEDYNLDEKIEYNINVESLHNIKEPLQELNNMVGMADLKENIVDQILYFSQNLHKISKTNETSGDYMHTVIYGPPGTGKTDIARIMGKIYSKMGILKRGIFKKVTRSDLIAGYLGQTAIKTRDVINECLGGVLFIDEAYSLGNTDKKDSFAKECIDTLCESLSAHKDNLMVIIAGYESELNECFFNYNQGLNSRFTWRFKTDEYKAKELLAIFTKKINDIGWSISEESTDSINVAWFEKKLKYFKFFGRDMEVFLSKIKIAHSRRVFCRNQTEKTKINFADLEKGFEIYLKNEEVKKRCEASDTKFALSSMYL